jgi:hypothetical protein
VYHNSIEGLVLFDYQEGSARKGPRQMLRYFKGYLQTDGYAVYDYFKEKKDIIVLHCMAHAPRMFFEAKDNNKAIAEELLPFLLPLIIRKPGLRGIRLDGGIRIKNNLWLLILSSYSGEVSRLYHFNLYHSFRFTFIDF